ncbi:hypothetical protein BX600DRAFT_433561 [Xylariales sp. PMI_506]|nr:hypothetical protein BX600DRAFT_433561 [Xylariales sp. PMI_506]
MSTLTMPLPHPHSNFHSEFAWQEPRRPEPSWRLHTEGQKIELPSIRQAFPELQLRVQQDGAARTPSSVTSPVSGPVGMTTPPEYIHSPSHHKRRRLSFDDDRESERPSQVPRFYASPARVSSSRHPSPSSVSRQAHEPWASSGRTSPQVKNSGVHSLCSPIERAEPRLSLPSLPHLEFERNAPQVSRMRSLSRDDYMPETARMSISHAAGPPTDGPPNAYRHASYDYAYHNQGMPQPVAISSAHPYDRSPFTSAAYGYHFQDNLMRVGELGMGMGGDNKQRKRRGNLPKETTDKLRAWFVAHLHHPYPTEDEKQDLMRQTGLQMNQISNWFINARRRQLPTMINNARAESDAMNNRGTEGTALTSTERIDYRHDSKRGSVPLSDGGSSNYDDADLDTIARRTTDMKRGSI